MLEGNFADMRSVQKSSRSIVGKKRLKIFQPKCAAPIANAMLETELLNQRCEKLYCQRCETPWRLL